jgi:ABC-type microcin C transport system permease subunit YejB
MAVTFVFACLVILFNLIADILYGWLDPRISYAREPDALGQGDPRRPASLA